MNKICGSLLTFSQLMLLASCGGGGGGGGSTPAEPSEIFSNLTYPGIESVIEITANAAKVTWPKHDDAVGYDIYRNGKIVKNISDNLTFNHQFNDLEPISTYSFKVRLVDSDNHHDNNNKLITITTLDTTPVVPSAVTVSSPAEQPTASEKATIKVTSEINKHTVKLYRDASCTEEVASAVVADKSATFNVPLELGVNTFYAKTFNTTDEESACSTVHGDVERVTMPVITGTLTRTNPTAEQDSNATPTVSLSESETDTTVKLYVDDKCQTEIASTSGTGSAIDLTVTSGLTVGVNKYYVKSFNARNAKLQSACVDTGLTYDYLPPISAPGGISLVTPHAVFDNNKPTVSVSNVPAGFKAAVYADAEHQVLVGEAVSAGSATNVTLSKPLTKFQQYNFYACTKDHAHNRLECYATPVAYTLVKSVDNPGKVTRKSPAKAYGEDTTPTLNIASSENGTTVKLFRDETCSTEIASTSGTGVALEVTTNALSTGVHKIYAQAINTSHNYLKSSCVDTELSYEVLEPLVEPTSIALTKPTNSNSTETKPVFTVGGVANGYKAAIYSDNQGHNLIAAAVSKGGATTVAVTTPLSQVEHTYNIFACTLDEAHERVKCKTDAQVDYTLLKPLANPGAVTRVTPAIEYGENRTPSFKVAASENNTTVKLFDDAACANAIGSEAGSGSAVTITTSELSFGKHDIYVQAINNLNSEVKSACVATNLSYDALEPLVAPSGLTINPNVSYALNAQPKFTVQGVQDGDTVAIYSELEHQNLVGEAQSAGTQVEVSTASKLSPATYDFYACVRDDAHERIACYSTPVTYEVAVPLIAPTFTKNAPGVTESTLRDTVVTVSVEDSQVGRKLEFFLGSDCQNEALATVDASLASNAIEVTGLDIGYHKFSAKITDVTLSESSTCVNTPWTFTAPNRCPDMSYAEVPTGAGDNYFCVMRYEARKSGGKAVSAPTPRPWTNISANAAFAQCNNLNTASTAAKGKYAIISEEQWMTIAKDIELNPSNWSTGTVGNGYIPRGYTVDITPEIDKAWDNGEIVDLSVDSTVEGTGQTKRTLQLSNKEIIWDLAGNLTEYVDWDATDGTMTEAPRLPENVAYYGEFYHEYGNVAEELIEGAKPIIDITKMMPATPMISTQHGIGVFSFASETYEYGATLTRGGSWADESNAGIYNFISDGFLEGEEDDYESGFRCVFIPNPAP